MNYANKQIVSTILRRCLKNGKVVNNVYNTDFYYLVLNFYYANISIQEYYSFNNVYDSYCCCIYYIDNNVRKLMNTDIISGRLKLLFSCKLMYYYVENLIHLRK